MTRKIDGRYTVVPRKRADIELPGQGIAGKAVKQHHRRRFECARRQQADAIPGKLNLTIFDPRRVGTAHGDAAAAAAVQAAFSLVARA